MKAGGNGKISIGAWIAIVMASVVGAIGSQADGQGPDPVMSGSVQVERLGSPAGRDLVLIPGLATPGEVWTDTVATLRDSVDAHVVTLAGFGDVPAVPRGEAGVVGSAVADLAAWLAAEGLDDAVLVGHSMGAQIALQLAAQAPDQVGAVVVVDSAPFFARLFNPAITEAQLSSAGPPGHAEESGTSTVGDGGENEQAPDDQGDQPVDELGRPRNPYRLFV